MEACPLLACSGAEELGPRAKSDMLRLLAADESSLRRVDVVDLASRCLGCHRCVKTCSQGVDVPVAISELRAVHPNFRSWLWKMWLANAGALWPVGAGVAGLVPESFKADKLGPFLKILTGMKSGRGVEPFLEPGEFSDTYRGEKMLLFAGCTANHLQRGWLNTARRLLQGAGVEIMPNEFACCGSGLKSAGCLKEAAAMEAANVEVWRQSGRKRIVTFCASCRSGLLDYSAFSHEQEAEAWGKSITSLSSIAQSITFVLSGKPPERIGYHRPCHVAGDDGDLVFLRQALADRLILPQSEECCGFGGVMRLAAPDLTIKVGKQCWDSHQGVEAVLTGCSACVAQLAATRPEGVGVGHWLDVVK